ncbi:MAG: hypothetical protein B9S34_01555 [Opitutia bacterium Tous-C1TDCM]|nr:MAG: hypothetical protein B9S34_01555 [Opitutae bacterium Tous-C1TDCM]
MPPAARPDRFRFPSTSGMAAAALPSRPAGLPPVVGGNPMLGNRALMRAWAARRSRLAAAAGLPRR